MSKQMKEAGSIVFLILAALLAGFIVGIVGRLLVLPPWWMLPSGSISAGCTVGFGYPDKSLPLWYRIIIGLCAGFLGWLISLFVAQAIL